MGMKLLLKKTLIEIHKRDRHCRKNMKSILMAQKASLFLASIFHIIKMSKCTTTTIIYYMFIIKT